MTAQRAVSRCVTDKDNVFIMAKVKVEHGWLEGEILDLATRDGKYFSFKGIPYASPPIGHLRFKAPTPLKSWDGVRKAVSHGPVCHQFDIFSNRILSGSEDCLYLNVYSPDPKPSKGAAVMVFFHGGGFKSGSGNSDIYGPDFLVKNGVVVVTVNYRLEVLGFLCLDTEEVPGNAGLKDQVAALRWVRDNISAFGGDPDNVTIFGESAGGASVGYHLVSPMSRGLFRRAILMSGTPLCEWASTYEPMRRTIQLAKDLGATDEILANSEKLLLFFQSTPLDKLINVRPAITFRETCGNPVNSFYFAPIVEKDYGTSCFLPQSVINSLESGSFSDVDVMIGYTSQESLLMAPMFADKDILDIINKYYDYLLPVDLALKVNPIAGFKIGDDVRKRYFGDKTLTVDDLNEIVEHSSWRLFKYGIWKFFKNLLGACDKEGKKFFYQFSCKSERNINETTFGEKYDVKGVSHLDDLMYIFVCPEKKLPLNENNASYKMILQTSTLFTNFAKFGNPTPDDSLGVKWLPCTAEDQNYLDINEMLTPGIKLDQEHVEFWEKIYSKAERLMKESLRV